MTYARWIRIVLGYLALVSLQIGLWATLAPRSFYDSFPGLGRAWISVDGPYNEHLLRDVGALNLALAVLIVNAAITLSRQLINVAAIASLVWDVPHLLYHLLNTGKLATSDVVISLGGLVLLLVAPVALLIIAQKHLDETVRDSDHVLSGSNRS